MEVTLTKKFKEYNIGDVIPAAEMTPKLYRQLYMNDVINKVRADGTRLPATIEKPKPKPTGKAPAKTAAPAATKPKK